MARRRPKPVQVADGRLDREEVVVAEAAHMPRVLDQEQVAAVRTAQDGAEEGRSLW